MFSADAQRNMELTFEEAIKQGYLTQAEKIKIQRRFS